MSSHWTTFYHRNQHRRLIFAMHRNSYWCRRSIFCIRGSTVRARMTRKKVIREFYSILFFFVNSICLLNNICKNANDSLNVLVLFAPKFKKQQIIVELWGWLNASVKRSIGLSKHDWMGICNSFAFPVCFLQCLRQARRRAHIHQTLRLRAPYLVTAVYDAGLRSGGVRVLACFHVISGELFVYFSYSNQQLRWSRRRRRTSPISKKHASLHSMRIYFCLSNVVCWLYGNLLELRLWVRNPAANHLRHYKGYNVLDWWNNDTLGMQINQ